MSSSSFNLPSAAIEDFLRQGGEIRLSGENQDGLPGGFLMQASMGGQQLLNFIDWSAVSEFRGNIIESVFKAQVDRLADRLADKRIGDQLSGPGYSVSVSTKTVPGDVGRMAH